MKTLPRTSLPERCWIFSKKRYYLKGSTLPQLPWVRTEYESILKANGIPYRKKFVDLFYSTTEEVCEYWDPNFGLEESEISLPLFAAVGDSYVNCQKKYCAKAPTSETIASANMIKKFIEDEIEDYENVLQDVYLYQLIKKSMSGSIAKMCNLKSYFYSIHDIEMNYDKFKILSLTDTDWVAIFDMNKIARNGFITLQVPKHIAGYVIGKSGRNIQNWAKNL